MAQRPNNIQNHVIDYGINQPEKSVKPKGSFEVFKGQGVRIG